MFPAAFAPANWSLQFLHEGRRGEWKWCRDPLSFSVELSALWMSRVLSECGNKMACVVEDGDGQSVRRVLRSRKFWTRRGRTRRAKSIKLLQGCPCQIRPALISGEMGFGSGQQSEIRRQSYRYRRGHDLVSHAGSSLRGIMPCALDLELSMQLKGIPQDRKSSNLFPL